MNRRWTLAWLLVASLGSPSAGQSLWNGRTAGGGGWITDTVALRVGDIITVMIEERQLVIDDGKVELSKEVELDASIQNFDVKPNTFNTLPALRYTNGRTFDGETKYSQNGDFRTTITAVVIDRQPNGNLLVEGRRTIELDGEYKQMHVRGWVRPVDVGTDNTVPSSKVANAHIYYDTEGDRSESTSKGWWEKLMDLIWPF